jgi:hypothetical protein
MHTKVAGDSKGGDTPCIGYDGSPCGSNIKGSPLFTGDGMPALYENKSLTSYYSPQLSKV